MIVGACKEKLKTILVWVLSISKDVRSYLSIEWIQYNEWTIDSRSGNWRTFIEPSAPHENRRPLASTCSCVTPWPMCLKKLLRACSPGNEYNDVCTERPHTYGNKLRMQMILIEICWGCEVVVMVEGVDITRISPSAEPVTKCSSCGSMARHLMALSWACRIEDWTILAR